MVKRPIVLLLGLYTISMFVVQIGSGSILLPIITCPLVLVVLRRYLPGEWIYLSCFYAAATVRLLGFQVVQPDDSGHWQLQEECSYHLEMVVTDTGRTASGTQRIEVMIFRLNGTRVKQKTLIYSADSYDVTTSDTLRGYCRFEMPSRARNPFEFDYRRYLATKGIRWILRPEGRLDIGDRDASEISSAQLLSTIRTGVRSLIYAHLDRDEAGVLLALIMGDKGGLEQTIREDFARTGTIHVLAVSGLHVGYVTLILFVISGFLRLPYAAKVCFTIGGLILYILFTGGAPSVIRASMMASVYLLASIFQRRSDLYNILAGAALVMLIVDPGQIRQIGFQLSFAAVFSIVTFHPILKGFIMKHLPDPFSRGPVNAVIDLLLVSLAAQIGTLPFTLYYFYRLPLIGSLVNLIVVPTVGFIVALGFALLFLGSWVPLLASAWGALLTVVIKLMTRTVAWVAELPMSYLDTPAISGFIAVLLMISVLLIFLLEGRRRIILLVFSVLVIMNTVQLIRLIHPPPVAELIFLDVGQGDAAVLHTAMGETIIFDTGPYVYGRDSGKDVIAPYLRRRGWNRIDLLVLSHPHNDHVGGTSYLLDHFRVDRLWIPGAEYDSRGYRHLISLAKERDVPIDTVHCGIFTNQFDPAILQVLGPPKHWSQHQPSALNDMSVVVKISVGESTAIITGDAELHSEREQLPFADILECDLLKVGHHGSITSSSLRYLELTSPQHAIISVGARNKFKHPSPLTVAKYERAGSSVLRTDQEGAVIFKTDGRVWERVDWRDD